MPTYHPEYPTPPQPTRIFFDPYNSSSTGHQHAKSRLSGSTSWRDSRTHKLAHQLRDPSGQGGEQYLSDLVGAGSERFGKDGRKDNGDWEVGAPGLREPGWQDIKIFMSGNRKRPRESADADLNMKRRMPSHDQQRNKDDAPKSRLPEEEKYPTLDSDDGPIPSGQQKKETGTSQPGTKAAQIFHNLTLYLNGSTAPLVSDHKLKQIFAQHGGNTSITPRRCTVTHVVLGDDHAGGGGLASSKIQKEVALVRGLGKGVRYVTAQWILDSVEKGVRQPESRYVPKGIEGRLGGSGQASMRAMFLAKTE